MASKRAKHSDPDKFLLAVGTGKSVVRFQSGQIIFSQGDPADAVCFLADGKIKLTVISKRGKEAVVALLKPRSFLGEGCLNGEQRRLTTAVALTDGSLVRIEKTAMVSALATDRKFSATFTAYLLERNSRIQEDLIDHLFNSSEKRLARVLLLLAHFGKEQDPEAVLPHVTQEMLAEMVGTTRSRVSFFMNKFRKLGFIHYNGTLEVHHSLLNVVLRD